MVRVTKCLVIPAAFLFWLPSVCFGESVPSAAYQNAQRFLEYYSTKHEGFERASIGQPCTYLLMTYEDVLAAEDLSQLLSTVPVFDYEFPVWVDGKLKRVIKIHPDRMTGEILSGGGGGRAASHADSVVWSEGQGMRSRELIRLRIDHTWAELVVVVGESGDTLLTPSYPQGVRDLSMTPGPTGEYPVLGPRESMHRLKAYAEEVRVLFERWRE